LAGDLRRKRAIVIIRRGVFRLAKLSMTDALR